MSAYVEDTLDIEKTLKRLDRATSAGRGAPSPDEVARLSVIENQV